MAAGVSSERAGLPGSGLLAHPQAAARSVQCHSRSPRRWPLPPTRTSPRTELMAGCNFCVDLSEPSLWRAALQPGRHPAGDDGQCALRGRHRLRAQYPGPSRASCRSCSPSPRPRAPPSSSRRLPPHALLAPVSSRHHAHRGHGRPRRVLRRHPRRHADERAGQPAEQPGQRSRPPPARSGGTSPTPSSACPSITRCSTCPTSLAQNDPEFSDMDNADGLVKLQDAVAQTAARPLLGAADAMFSSEGQRLLLPGGLARAARGQPGPLQPGGSAPHPHHGALPRSRRRHAQVNTWAVKYDVAAMTGDPQTALEL